MGLSISTASLVYNFSNLFCHSLLILSEAIFNGRCTNIDDIDTFIGPSLSQNVIKIILTIVFFL